MKKPFKPHLACDAKVEKLEFPLWVQNKVDGCFSGDTMIHTEKGMVPIKDIVDYKKKVKVFSYNEESGIVELKPIINWFNNGLKDTVSFRGSRCTANHKMYSKGEWVRRDEDPLYSEYDNKEVMEVLTGMLLGDGCLISERREGGFGALRLKFSVCEKDIQYGNLKGKLLSSITDFRISPRISGYGFPQIDYTSKMLNKLPLTFSHLYNVDLKNKETYGKRLENLNNKDISPYFGDISLALWIFDDGSVVYNNGNLLTPRISISVARYSDTSVEELKKVLNKKYKVSPSFTKHGVDKTLTFTTQETYYLLGRITTIAGGLLPRKIPKCFRNDIIPTPVTLGGIKSVTSRNRLPAINTIKKITYDIEVEGNHNYFANGVLVHNCRMLVRNGIATGRSMKKYKNKRMTEYFSQPCFEGFDMEIGATYPNDPDLCRLSTSVVNTIEGKLPEFAVIFDYLHPDVIHLEYKDRMKYLATYLDETNLPSEVELIYSNEYLVSDAEDLADAYANALEDNYEGLIIRKQEGLHKSGRCTVKEANYLRMKPTGDSEGIVTSVEEAYENLNVAKVNDLGYTERSTHKENMRPKGMVGALWLKDIHSGSVVKIGSGKLTHEERTYYFENQDKIIGQLVKYAFLATGQKDKPRHPRYISHRSWEDMSK